MYIFASLQLLAGRSNIFMLWERVAEISVQLWHCEELSSSPTCHYKLAIFSHQQVAKDNPLAVLMNTHTSETLSRGSSGAP